MRLFRLRQRARIIFNRAYKVTIARVARRWRKYFRIVLPKASYERLKQDNDFLNSLQLARLINEIRSVQRNYVRIPDNGDPANTRDLCEQQYIYSAVVFEALRSLLKLAGELKHLKAWDQHRSVTKELNQQMGDATSYYNMVLAPIRNVVIFHFDRKAIVDAVDILAVREEIDLMLSRSKIYADMTLPLVFDLVLNYVLAKDTRSLSGQEKSKEWLVYVLNLSSKIITVASACILEVWTRHARRFHGRLPDAWI